MKREHLRKVEYFSHGKVERERLAKMPGGIAYQQGQQGYFHGWATDSRLEIGHKEEYVGIHTTYALVEDMGGEIQKIPPDRIRFVS